MIANLLIFSDREIAIISTSITLAIVSYIIVGIKKGWRKLQYSIYKSEIAKRGLEESYSQLALSFYEEKPEVRDYINSNFSNEQLIEILLGMDQDINVSQYANITLSPEEMRAKREELVELNKSEITE